MPKESVKAPPAQTLKIMGARNNQNAQRRHRFAHLIFAFDQVTDTPVQAQWQYQGDADWTLGMAWEDTQPDRSLSVRLGGGETITLNPVNITGNGHILSGGRTGAYVALRKDGSIVAWGDPATGGEAEFSSPLVNIVEVSSTESAFAARNAQGEIFAWGNPAHGGSTGDVATTGFARVIGNAQAFAGVKANASLVAWGNPILGGKLPPELVDYTDIRSVSSTDRSFAALRSTGHVIAWGSSDWGGELPAELQELNDIVQVIGNAGAFAALRKHAQGDQLVAWGNAFNGGDLPAELRDDLGGKKLCCVTDNAFAALREDGRVIVWGNDDADPPPMQGVISICATDTAFAALQTDGHVIAWGGTSDSGGVVPAPIGALDDIVQLASSRRAFAALRRNGKVVAWGDPGSGGVIGGAEDALVDVRAIYANARSFLALTATGGVVTWGLSTAGGDSNTQQPELAGKVLYQLA